MLVRILKNRGVYGTSGELITEILIMDTRVRVRFRAVLLEEFEIKTAKQTVHNVVQHCTVQSYQTVNDKIGIPKTHGGKEG